jgi:predicted nucleotidyltransferase
MPQAPASELVFKATELIRQKLSNVLAIYVFGSRVTENTSKHCDVALLDMRAASTVMH